MSLKAYDGMMTKKGISYLQEKIKEKIPEFKKASLKQLSKTYAEFFLDYVDKKDSIDSKILFMSKTKKEQEEIKSISKENITILSYLFKVAKILSKSEYLNDFVIDLKMSLEVKGDKILVYPGIFVPEHRKILLSFLDDWYAQNQCDPDENVPESEWEERCKDWNNFSETRGFSMNITLFDSKHYWDNIIDFFRGDELINGILSEIPSDEDRKNSIWKTDFINEKMKEYLPENPEMYDYSSAFFKANDFYRSDEGQKEFELFKTNNPIELKKIDADFLLNEKFTENAAKES